MTDLQTRFVEEYTVDFNGAAATRRAGYSANTAKQEAHKLLKHEDIKAAIKERLDALAMTADEAIKHTSDIARTRLNDYLKIEKVLRTPMVRKPLSVLIEDIQAEIKLESEFLDRAFLTEKEQDVHHIEQLERKRQMLRYQIELEHNPNAYRDMPGESVWVEEVSPDLVALAKDKEKGRIKGLSFNEHGPKIDMYPADAALSKVLEYHGKVKGVGDTNVVIFQIPDNGR